MVENITKYKLVDTDYAVNVPTRLDRPTDSNFADFPVSAVN